MPRLRRGLHAAKQVLTAQLHLQCCHRRGVRGWDFGQSCAVLCPFQPCGSSRSCRFSCCCLSVCCSKQPLHQLCPLGNHSPVQGRAPLVIPVPANNVVCGLICEKGQSQWKRMHERTYLSLTAAPCDTSKSVACRAKSRIAGKAAREATMCNGGEPSQRAVTLAGFLSSSSRTTSSWPGRHACMPQALRVLTAPRLAGLAVSMPVMSLTMQQCDVKGRAGIWVPHAGLLDATRAILRHQHGVSPMDRLFCSRKVLLAALSRAHQEGSNGLEVAHFRRIMEQAVQQGRLVRTFFQYKRGHQQPDADCQRRGRTRCYCRHRRC